MSTATLPALQGHLDEWGYDGRHRIFTRDHGTYDELQAEYGEHRGYGVSGVVLNGYAMSTSSLCGFMSSPSVRDADDGMHKLSLSFHQGTERHPLDGTRYPTREDAERAAFDAGVYGFMVYERVRETGAVQ